jgi:phage-related protein
MGDGFKIADAYVDITADTSKVGSGVEETVGKDKGGFFKGAGAIIGGILGANLIQGAVSIVRSGLADGFHEAEALDAVNAQFTAGLASTGNAAHQSVKELDARGDAIQAMSGQTAESIDSAQALLLTFTNIRDTPTAPIFDEATTAAANMAARFGGDASDSAIKLGKALQDPTTGITALSRVGVEFTAQQKEQIKTMQDAGNMAGAQGVILAELNKEFGGSAEAAGQTLPGALSRLKLEFVDLGGSIVTKMIPVILPALNAVAAGVEKIGPFVDGLLKKAEPTFSAIGGAISKLAPTFEPLIGQVLKLATSFSPFHLVIEAILPSLPVIMKALEEVGKVLSGAIAEVLPLVSKLFGELATILSGALKEAMPIIAKLIEEIGGVLKEIMPSILDVAKALGGALLDVFKALAPILPAVANLVLSLFEAIKPLIPVALDLGTALWPLIGKILPPLLSILAPIISLLGPILTPIIKLLTPVITILADVLEFVVTVLGDVVAGVVDFEAWLVQLITGNKEAVKQLTDVWNTIIGFFSGLWNSITSFFATGLKNIGDWFSSLPKTILGYLVDADKWLIDTGTNMITGLIKGIEGAIGGVVTAITKGVQGAINGVKSFLGIHSPSTVFADEIGSPIATGIAQGVDTSAPSIQSSIKAATTPVPYGVQAGAASSTASAIDDAGAAYSLATGDNGQIILQFAAGSIVLDATNIKDWQDIVDMLMALPQVARSGPGTTKAA